MKNSFAMDMEEAVSDVEEQAESQYNQYVTEQLKEALKSTADVESVLNQFNIPTSANMVAAVEAILQNNSKVVKDLYGKAAVQQDMDINDLIDMAYSRLREACNSPDEMIKAEEEMLGTLAENVMKTMLETEDVRTVDLDGMKLIVQQTKAIQEMATTGETYHIPVKMNDEIGSMNVRFVRGQGEIGLIKMALYMESKGTVSTTFRYEADEVNANVECDRADVRNRLMEKKESIEEAMKEATGFTFNFSFVRETGVTVNDVYNWQLGNFEVVDKRDNEVQTEALYGIARSFMDIMSSI